VFQVNLNGIDGEKENCEVEDGFILEPKFVTTVQFV
jgi:hypothetical protein